MRWVVIRRGGLIAALSLTLAGCGGLPLSLLSPGGIGPDVAANVQAGRTNAQTIGPAHFSDQRLVRPEARSIEQSAGETGLRAEAVGNVTVRNDAPPWLLLVALLGWLAPSPGEIARKLRGLMGMK